MHSNSYYPDASLIFYLHLTHIFAAQTKNIFFSPTQNNWRYIVQVPIIH